MGPAIAGRAVLQLSESRHYASSLVVRAAPEHHLMDLKGFGPLFRFGHVRSLRPAGAPPAHGS